MSESPLSGWNILDACRNKNCKCVNLAGSTFVAILGDECEYGIDLPLTLQIYENNTFALRTHVRIVDSFGLEQVVFGTWKCCNGIWAGVSVTGFANPLTQCEENQTADHYVRISLQICPNSNTIRWRRIYFVATEDACLSDKEPGQITYVSEIFERKLQRIVNPCEVSDHDLKLPPTVVPQ